MSYIDWFLSDLTWTEYTALFLIFGVIVSMLVGCFIGTGRGEDDDYTNV